MNDRADLTELLETLDIEWVLQREGVQYKRTHGRSGPQLNLRVCPACGNNGSKVYIGAESGIGSCFVADCDLERFNKWKFLSHLFDQKGRSLIETITSLAREQGWRPKRTTPAATFNYSDLQIPESAAISDMPTAPEYLTRRGITKEIASYFGLRWCERGAFEIEVQGRRVVQDYSQRIIIPVLDLDQTLVTFQGRDASGRSSIEGSGVERYLFPPAFSASGAFLYNALNWQSGMSHAVICEGVFDVIATKIAIDADQDLRDILPIGTFGIRLSTGSAEGNDQFGRLRSLKKAGLKRVTFLWDGELRAIKQAILASIEVRKLGIDVYIAILPPKKDPGDCSPSEILKAIRGAYRAGTKLDLMKIMKFLRTNVVYH